MLTLGGGALSAQQPAFRVSQQAMEGHLRFLASDLLEGRAPGMRGGRLAADYIAAVYQTLGLEPAGPNGSYFQPVALVGMTPQPTFTWGPASGESVQLTYRDDYVA
ncbi:MAG: peptidase M28, partial [Gammaproteobacteria bacterium]